MGGGGPVGDQHMAAEAPAAGLVVVEEFPGFGIRVAGELEKLLHCLQGGRRWRGRGGRRRINRLAAGIFNGIFFKFFYAGAGVFSLCFFIVYMFIYKGAHFWAWQWPISEP